MTKIIFNQQDIYSSKNFINKLYLLVYFLHVITKIYCKLNSLTEKFYFISFWKTFEKK